MSGAGAGEQMSGRPLAVYNNNVKRDEIGTGSAGKREKWKKGNNGEGVINFAQSPPPAELSFKI